MPTPSNKQSSRAKRRYTRVFWVWLILLLLIACSRFAAPQQRLFDLLAGISGFVIPVASLTFLVLALRGRWVSALVALVVALVAYQPVHQAVVVSLRSSAAGGGMVTSVTPYRFTILLVNVQGSAEALAALEKLLDYHQPNLVALIEAGQETGRDFLSRQSISNGYPFIVLPDRSILYSIALLSKHPLQRLAFRDDPRSIDETLYAFHHSYAVDFPFADFIFTAAHPPSPRTNASWRRGNEKTAALARLARRELSESGQPVIIAGDFNAPLIGYRQRIMKSSSGLVPSDELVAGLFNGTWPAHYPAILRLTLDRLWVSAEQVKIVNRAVLEDIGSDHRPVLFTLDLEPDF